jgi:hypothetical protein
MIFRSISRNFSESAFGKLVDQLNTIFSRLSIDDNMVTQTVTLEDIPAGSEFSVPHSLRDTPKYRSIMRQRGGGLVTDGDTEWTDSAIYLKNTGSSSIDSVTIVIWRK